MLKKKNKKLLWLTTPAILALTTFLSVTRCGGSSGGGGGGGGGTSPAISNNTLPDFACPPRGILPPVTLPATIQHVFVVVLENADVNQATPLPYFHTLMQNGGYLSNFHASTHPSYPNYLSMIAGSSFGIHDDNTTTLPNQSIVDLLESAGKTWKVYAENYPGGCANVNTALFAARHVPFLSFNRITGNGARCANIVDATTLATDIQNNALPNYAMYIPNINNDGHDTSATYADNWLNNTFSAKLSDAKFITNTLFVVTFDEAETLSSNQIYTVLYGPNVVAGSSSAICYTHQDLLKTFEDLLGLGNLGTGDASGVDIRGVW